MPVSTYGLTQMHKDCSTTNIAQRRRWTPGTAFGCPRDFLGNRFVYLVISPRAKGLSIGVNMNPDQHCNFDCAYCEVDRSVVSLEKTVDLHVMAAELQRTLNVVRTGMIREFAPFNQMPDSLLQLKHVTLSGDGEPTLCENFAEVVQTVMHIRARSSYFFKIVLITNATGLDTVEVQTGLRSFTKDDEIWAKLDGGTQAYLQKVNGTAVPIQKILANILLVARQRPVVIQSLFPSVNGLAPAPEEIMEYVARLKELKDAGAQISLAQIYSATRPTPRSECGHLPLKTLSQIAQTVRAVGGIKAEVF